MLHRIKPFSGKQIPVYSSMTYYNFIRYYSNNWKSKIDDSSEAYWKKEDPKINQL